MWFRINRSSKPSTMNSINIAFFAILAIVAFSSPMPNVLGTVDKAIQLPAIECDMDCRRKMNVYAEKLGCVHPVEYNSIEGIAKLECKSGTIGAQALETYLKEVARVQISDQKYDWLPETDRYSKSDVETDLEETDEEEEDTSDPDSEVLNGEVDVMEGEGKMKEGEGILKVGEARLKEAQGKMEQAQGLIMEGKDEIGEKKLEEGEAKVDSADSKVTDGEAIIKQGEEKVHVGEEKVRDGEYN